MGHTIQISDELWELYDGSPTAMRDTLWQAKVAPPRQETPPEVFETTIELQWSTRCSMCGKQLLAGEKAMYRVPPEGAKQIVCMDDAREMEEQRQLEAFRDE